MLFPVNEKEHHDLLGWDKAAIVVELILIGIYILGLITSGSATKIDAAQLLLRGDFGMAFLILVVFLGLLVPIVLEFAESRLKKFAAVTAPVLILIGGFAMRWILVYAGQVG
jgi:formate-dependent nitrite reductase membrane component NrfD